MSDNYELTREFLAAMDTKFPSLECLDLTLSHNTDVIVRMTRNFKCRTNHYISKIWRSSQCFPLVMKSISSSTIWPFATPSWKSSSSGVWLRQKKWSSGSAVLRDWVSWHLIVHISTKTVRWYWKICDGWKMYTLKRSIFIGNPKISLHLHGTTGSWKWWMWKVIERIIRWKILLLCWYKMAKAKSK